MAIGVVATAPWAAWTADSAQQPTFHVGVDYVRVDVVVTDSEDKPVANLPREAFAIAEDGRPQRIADFQYISIPVLDRPVEAGAGAPPARDVGTNIPTSPRARAFVMVVDDLHILASEIVPVKRVMTDFLRALSPDDEVAIVFVGRSDLGVNFTSDMTRLTRAVDHVRDAMGFGLGADLRGSPSGDPIDGRLQYARSAAWVLRNVAAALASSDHVRRAILYVSGQSTLDPNAPLNSSERLAAATYGEELALAFDAARRADVPIYSLDPRGLVMPETAVVGWIATADDRQEIARRIGIQQDYLVSIAANTGGRAFINEADLTRAVDAIVQENGSFYLLGYYPDPLVQDGRFHDLRVTVQGNGLRVRARRGYVAAAPPGTTGTVPPPLDAALSAGLNMSGLGLRAVATPVAATAKGMLAAVTVDVSYPAPSGGQPREMSDTLAWGLVALDGDGRTKASARGTAAFRATPATAPAMTLHLDDAIDLPAQPLTLRVAVASQALGSAGSVQLPVEAPRLRKDLEMGGLVLGDPAAQAGDVLGAERLRGLVPFQPTTARVFARNAAVRVFARLFWASKDTTASATIAVAGSQSPAPRAVTLPGSIAAHDRREATLDAIVPLAGLPPGAYVLHVEAHLPHGKPVSRRVAVEIR